MSQPKTRNPSISYDPYAMEGMTLRQLGEEDAGQFFALQNLVLKGLPDASWFIPSSQEELTEQCRLGEAFGYFARGKLKAVATLTPSAARAGRSEGISYAAVLQEPEQDTLDVRNVLVHPDFRRRGLQSALLKLFEEMAKALGAKALYATVAPGNLPSNKGFEKAGYVRHALLKVGENLPRTFYRKDVESPEALESSMEMGKNP